MLKLSFLLTFLLLFISALFAQIGVNSDNSQPDSSALLDVKSTSKGLLPPRMTTTQMNGIISPAAGLMVYNTALQSIFWFNGTSWTIWGNRDGQSCGSVFYGGKTYHSVVIGMQCWMSENLNIGAAIPGSQEQTDNGIIEKYCYGNNSANCDVYGGLYQWNELMNYTPSSSSNPSGCQGICPQGWHVPSNTEFCQMETYLDATVNCADFINGTDAGGKLKETGTSHWNSPNTGATNASGFTALPGGNRYSDGGFYYLTSFAYFWSAAESSETNAFSPIMGYNYAHAAMGNDIKARACSARCCKN